MTRKGPLTSVPSGVTNDRSKGSVVSPSNWGSNCFRLRHLGFPVALLLDDGGVDAQRDVVDEEAVVHRRIVDPALEGIAEGVHALARVPAVQPEVEGEVVPRARRHANEGEIVLHRDGGDQCL